MYNIKIIGKYTKTTYKHPFLVRPHITNSSNIKKTLQKYK